MVAREEEKCKLYLVGVQKVRWEKVDTEQQGILHFSMQKGMKIIS
jgi:hypothetical protein